CPWKGVIGICLDQARHHSCLLNSGFCLLFNIIPHHYGIKVVACIGVRGKHTWFYFGLVKQQMHFRFYTGFLVFAYHISFGKYVGIVRVANRKIFYGIGHHLVMPHRFEQCTIRLPLACILPYSYNSFISSSVITALFKKRTDSMLFSNFVIIAEFFIHSIYNANLNRNSIQFNVGYLLSLSLGVPLALRGFGSGYPLQVLATLRAFHYYP